MKHVITDDKYNEYQTLMPLLESMYHEIKTFASKKQDGSLSKLKVSALNQILERAMTLLQGEPFSEFLQILDIDTLPSNSDAVMIIANYRTAMNGFYKKYTTSSGLGSRSWNRGKSNKSIIDDEE